MPITRTHIISKNLTKKSHDVLFSIEFESDNCADDTAYNMWHIRDIIRKDYALVHLLPQEYHRYQYECKRYLTISKAGKRCKK